MKTGHKPDQALEQALLDATAQARRPAPTTLRLRILRSLQEGASSQAHNLPHSPSSTSSMFRFSPAVLSALAAGAAGLIFAAIYFTSRPEAPERFSRAGSQAGSRTSSMQAPEPSVLNPLKEAGPALRLLAPEHSLAAAEKPLVEEIRKLRSDGSSVARALSSRLPAPLDQLLGFP